MKTLSSILLFTSFALAAAMPWYSNSHKSRASHQRSGYYDSEGYYHNAAETAMTHKTFSAAKIQQEAGILDICQSAKYGFGNIDTYVHVCETGVLDSGDKEYCFITNGDCCIISSSSGSPVKKFKLTLEELTVNVKYYLGASGARGACFDLDKHIDVCGGCPEPFCVDTVCLDNTETGTLSSCDSNGHCTCKPGFALPDCCECDFDNGYFRHPETGECRRFCDTCRRRTMNGCAECVEGYAGLDCCDCDKDHYRATDDTCKSPECMKNLDSCTNEQCTCNPGYLPPDCCVCANGLSYNLITRTCEEPCGNTVECREGKCTCRPGFIGDRCCEKQCVSEQDIFFVVDVTGSNSRDSFCETHYGTELLLAALKPGSGSTDTRVEMVLFPKTASVSENELRNLILFPLGTGCEEAVGDGLTLIETFYNYGFADPPLNRDYFYKILAPRTYPAPAIQAVRRSIESSTLKRPRVVVIITDGIIEEGYHVVTVDEVDELRKLESETITVIVGGYTARVSNVTAFREQLKDIAGPGNENEVVIESNSVDLARGIVRRMAAAGAICPEQEKEILKQLQNSDVRPLCECIKSRRTRSNIPSQKSCCVPAGFTCDQETKTIGRNPYYEPSKNCPITNKNKKSELEREILQAVEEVLQQRLDIN